MLNCTGLHERGPSDLEFTSLLTSGVPVAKMEHMKLYENSYIDSKPRRNRYRLRFSRRISLPEQDGNLSIALDVADKRDVFGIQFCDNDTIRLFPRFRVYRNKSIGKIVTWLNGRQFLESRNRLQKADNERLFDDDLDFSVRIVPRIL